MAKEIISFQIEEELKEEAEKLFSEIGMTVEEALNIFIKRSVKEKRIPFEIRLDVSNKEDNLEFIYVEALKSLIKKGYSNDELVEEFEKNINLIKLAKKKMLEESRRIASGEISGITFEEIFDEEK